MFQDFNHLHERRKAERAQKLRKRILIGVALSLVVVAAIAAGVFFVVTHGSDNSEYGKKPQVGGSTKEKGAAKEKGSTKEKGESSSGKGAGSASEKETAAPAGGVAHLEKGVKMVCSATDYQATCESSLKKEMEKNKTSTNPMDLIKASVSVIIDELDIAFNSSIKEKVVDDPKVKAAIEDCGVLVGDAKEELLQTLGQINGTLDKLSLKSPEMNNWLSAVVSYQQTCIDGFPDGDLKSSLEKGMNKSLELTSNALAIVSELSSFLTSMKASGVAQRRLLGNESSGHSLDNDGFPTWMSQEDRRMLKAETSNLKPNKVVAKDGSGDFKTINEALAAMPTDRTERYIIYVKEGVYEENVIITKKMVNVTIFGDGSMKSIVSGSKNYVDGVTTYQTATFAAIGDGFMAQSMGFRNTAGPEKHQAVALRVQSDRSVFQNCRMEGYQDTLYVQTHRQFYRSCVIAGTVDFIFGDAAAVIQNTMIVVRKPLDDQQNMITAQGRTDKHESTGIVLHNCRILPDDKLVPVKSTIKSYLGRPWKEYSRTVVMESEIGDFIHPDGWAPWKEDFALATLSYAEYKNTGPGASVTARVKWPGYKVINKDEAMKFTVANFLQGESWVKESGAPVRLGLFE